MDHESTTPGSPMKNKSNKKNHPPQRQLQRLLAEKASRSLLGVCETGVVYSGAGGPVHPWHPSGCDLFAFAGGHGRPNPEPHHQSSPGLRKITADCGFLASLGVINHPEVRFLYSSYRQDLAERDSVKCRRLIQSDWYQQRWGDRYQMVEDQNQKHRFENDRTVYRIVVPKSGGTGERGDVVVVDDPHSVEQADSDAARNRCH
jgi:hypothetical protein